MAQPTNSVPTLRVARPTDNIDALLYFYRDGLGFNILSHFKGHEGFDGVMLGQEGYPYHFEFTHQHGHTVGRTPTNDNLLIFYIPDKDQWQQTVNRMVANGFDPVKSYNPYWELKGKTFEDPDGYRVVIQHSEWRP